MHLTNNIYIHSIFDSRKLCTNEIIMTKRNPQSIAVDQRGRESDSKQRITIDSLSFWMNETSTFHHFNRTSRHNHEL